MRYMLLIYSKEAEMAQMSQEETDKIKSAHWAVMEETSKRGIFRGAEPCGADDVCEERGGDSSL